MKKLIQFIALFFLFLFFLSTKTLALEPFTKYSNNPLVFSGEYQNWSEVGAVQPFVILENDLYKMWYITFNGSKVKIAYATSPDAKNWTRNALLDINPSFDFHNPTLLKTQTGYTLFYASSLSGGEYRIGKISLSDESHFDPQSEKYILSQSAYPAWDSTGISDPFIYYKDSKYYLFYAGRGQVDEWNLGLAISTDGENWERCLNNPILISAAGPHLLTNSNTTYIFFHSPNGVEQIETDEVISCDTNWKNRHLVVGKGPESYDQKHIISPSALGAQNNVYLHYSGLGADNIWRIILAISPTQISTPTVTPTLSPAPTLSPSPTPTPSSKIPLVIIPGLFASWNKEAILHNQPVNNVDWKILPFVREYDGIINTLKALGYLENKDYFIFTYDWRKSLDDIAGNFDSFLQQKVWALSSDKKINIVGHSLGGLVARIWEQKFSGKKLVTLVTVGSPHQGVAQVYKPVAAGEIERDNTFFWLAEKLLLLINTGMFPNNREIIANIFPILKDVLPTFPYLRSPDGMFLDPSQQQVKNDTLFGYNKTISEVFDHLKTKAGHIGETIAGFQIEPQTALDRLLNLYPDGRPTLKLTKPGDSVVPLLSANIGNNTKTFSLNHGEIIYKKDAIREILDSLSIPYQENQVTEGGATQINPSLIFLIKSPAEISVTGPQGEKYFEQDGMIFIPNPLTGNYKLEVTGKELGNYSVIVGEISTSDDNWQQIDGVVEKQSPSAQIDRYEISFDSANPKEFFIDQNDIAGLFDMLITKLRILKLPRTVHDLLLAKNDYENKRWRKLKDHLFDAHKNIFIAWNRNRSWNDMSGVISQIENLYEVSLRNTSIKISQKELERELSRFQKIKSEKELQLLRLKNRGKEVTFEARLLKIVLEKLQKTDGAIKHKNFIYAEILLKSIAALFKLI